jgi:hypothetical protein
LNENIIIVYRGIQRARFSRLVTTPSKSKKINTDLCGLPYSNIKAENGGAIMYQ